MAIHTFDTRFTVHVNDTDIEDFLIDHVLTEEPGDGWSATQFFANDDNIAEFAEAWARSLMPSAFTLTQLEVSHIHNYGDEVDIDINVTVEGPLDTTLLTEVFSEI